MGLEDITLCLFLRIILKIIFFRKTTSINKFQNLESRIGYTFRNKNILEEALTHKSLNSGISYERLEFLGDALLNIIVTEWLYQKHPKYDEGLLTKKRSQLVNKQFLLQIVKKIFIKKDLIIGNSIQINNSSTMNNIFSDIFESILGAIYIDGGLVKAKKFIDMHLIINSNKLNMMKKNYKGMLIEKCHSLGYETPCFKSIQYNSNFKAEVIINNTLYTGVGSSKKRAEINAAKAALKEL